ncbi:MAG: glycosyltransferase [Planctomycetaceae bacterium]
MSDFNRAIAPYESSFSLSVIIPAWNEESVIALAIDEALVALSSLGLSHELIVVDDGSLDRTAEIVEAACQRYPQLRLVRHDENRGYGAALRSGFEASRGRLVAFTDADCQFDLTDLAPLLSLAEQYDIVSGYRIDRQDTPLRCFYSWGYNTLIRGLLKSPLRDVDCALKVFRREALMRIMPEARAFFANTEMFTEARLLGLSINEVGVRHRPRAAGTSSVSIRDIPRTLGSLLPYWWQRVQFPGHKTTKGSPSVAALLLIMLTAGFLLFQGLAYPLVEPDEGRYAEIGREMLRSGDWIIPRLHHEPYLDKPPLFYWLCATSFSLFGPTDWAARLVPALSAWLTVVVTYLFGCRLLGRTSAFLGTMTLTLSFGFVACGRFLILDSLLAFLVVSSLFAAHEAVSRERLQWGWWLASAFLCGLGVLTKGPVAFVLLEPVVMAHCWLNRSSSRVRLHHWSAFAGVIVLTAAPWFVAAATVMPQFVRYFFWDHNVARFLSGSNHPEPFWFYLPTLFLACMPWGLLLLPLTKFLATASPQMRKHRSPELGFLTLWSAWCLLFFSASSGKLPTYLLPCLPAVMLLIGHCIHATCSPFAGNVFSRVKAHAVFHRGLVYLSSAGVLFAGCLYLFGLDERVATLLHGSLWTGLLFAALVLQRRVAPRIVYGVFCAAAFMVLTKITHDVVPAVSNRNSAFGNSSSTLVHQGEWKSHLPVACIVGDWGSVPFYLDRDDVSVFPDTETENARHFIEDHDEMILVVNENLTEEQREAFLPPDAEVRQLSTTSKATALAVRLPNATKVRIQLISADANEIPKSIVR